MRRTFLWGSHNEHEYAIVETIAKLLDRGLTVYVEHEVFLEPQKRKRIVPDIYAKGLNAEYIIEVGTLSEHYSQPRLKLLKQLHPHAKVIHITQWKNWLTTFDWEAANPMGLVDVAKMGESLVRRKHDPLKGGKKT